MLKKMVLTAVLLSMGCVFGSDYETVHYTSMIELDFDIESIVTNECIRNYVDAFPVEPDSTGFYLIETPEQIDSVLNVYYPYEWSPRLEDYFPGNGMLLVYLRNCNLEDIYQDHSVTFYDRTVYIDLAVDEYNGDEDIRPGIRTMIIPIGIIPRGGQLSGD